MSQPRACPYCGAAIVRWRSASSLVDDCGRCRRPLVLAPARRRIYALLDLVWSVFGYGMVALVLLFATALVSPSQFGLFLVLLHFLAGSVLACDGVLSMLSGLDRSLGVIAWGKRAKWIGAFKIAAGTIALGLVVWGLLLFT